MRACDLVTVHLFTGRRDFFIVNRHMAEHPRGVFAFDLAYDGRG
jgi:hypothetical protein